jgi:hypothetical protein
LEPEELDFDFEIEIAFEPADLEPASDFDLATTPKCLNEPRANLKYSPSLNRERLQQAMSNQVKLEPITKGGTSQPITNVDNRIDGSALRLTVSDRQQYKAQVARTNDDRVQGTRGSNKRVERPKLVHTVVTEPAKLVHTVAAEPVLEENKAPTTMHVTRSEVAWCPSDAWCPSEDTKIWCPSEDMTVNCFTPAPCRQFKGQLIRVVAAKGPGPRQPKSWKSRSILTTVGLNDQNVGLNDQNDRSRKKSDRSRMKIRMDLPLARPVHRSVLELGFTRTIRSNESYESNGYQPFDPPSSAHF